MAGRERLLLDTCALIWLAAGDSRFTPEKTQTVIAAGEEDRLFANVITLWELGYLQQKGRLDLKGLQFRQFWDMAKTRINLRSVPITESIVSQYHALDGQLHNDPADRFIVACAIQQRCTLVTGDLKLLEWGSKHGFPILAL